MRVGVVVVGEASNIYLQSRRTSHEDPLIFYLSLPLSLSLANRPLPLSSFFFDNEPTAKNKRRHNTCKPSSLCSQEGEEEEEEMRERDE